MEKIDKTRLTDDTLSYKIQILEIQETHMKDTELLRNSYKWQQTNVYSVSCWLK